MWDKIRDTFSRFMFGRNGMDALNQSLCWGYVILCVIRMIAVGILRLRVPGHVLDVVLNLAALAVIYRAFSRNLSRRQRENQRWLMFRNQFLFRVRTLKNSGGGLIARYKDREHKYFTCKNCGTVCRVPSGKGNIIITCPHCGKQIHAKT